MPPICSSINLQVYLVSLSTLNTGTARNTRHSVWKWKHHWYRRDFVDVGADLKSSCCWYCTFWKNLASHSSALRTTENVVVCRCPVVDLSWILGGHCGQGITRLTIRYSRTSYYQEARSKELAFFWSLGIDMIINNIRIFKKIILSAGRLCEKNGKLALVEWRKTKYSYHNMSAFEKYLW